MKFLDPYSKADDGKDMLAGVGTFGNAGPGPLYTENGKGVPVDKDATSSQSKGNRIDNQGNVGQDQIFNIQAQTNGGKSTTFATCIGWSDCGANAGDIVAGLQASAEHQAVVHLVSQGWRPSKRVAQLSQGL